MSILQIKTGLAVHADYQFDIVGSNGVVKNSYTFLHTSLNDIGLDDFAKNQVFQYADLGVSNVPVQEDQDYVLVPMYTVNVTECPYTVQYIDDAASNYVYVKMVHTLTYRGFGVSANNTLTLNEFGIRGVNRVVLVDSFQDLNGLVLQQGDTVRVYVAFTYTYYTNNKTLTLGDDVFGTTIDYTSETFVLPNASQQLDTPFAGYRTPNVLRIYPITQDIRSTPTDQISIPTGVDDLPYQHYRTDIDDVELRIDAEVIGYRPDETQIYGFVLRDQIRQVGVLVRFSVPVIISATKRYAVGGYIRWTNKIESLNEGTTTADFNAVSETVPISGGVDAISITRPVFTDDVLVGINQLAGTTFTFDNTSIVIPNNATFADVVRILQSNGIEATLFSTKPARLQASTFEYMTPDPASHGAFVQQCKDDATAKAVSSYFLPARIITGAYAVNTASNSWVWDNYFPYIGEGFTYYAYAYFGYKKALADITNIANLNDQNLVTFTKVKNGVSIDATVTTFKASDLVSNRVVINTQTALTQILSYTHTSDPLNNNNGYLLSFTSDFDTPKYKDWVSGTTNVKFNYKFLDLTTNVDSDTARNVTQFTYTFDSTINSDADVSLWFDKTNLGPFRALDLNAINTQYAVYITKNTVGTKTSYTFKKVYDASHATHQDIFIIANTTGAFSTHASGAIRIDAGVQGYRVYNVALSEISSSVSTVDKLFLMAGIRLYPPLPMYTFKQRILTAAEASRFYKDPSITATLNSNLFTITKQATAMSVVFNSAIDSLNPNLNSLSLYPAIGFDLSKVDVGTLDTAYLFTDPNGKSWTKAMLYAHLASNPEQFIDQTLYFVYPTKLSAGSHTAQYGLDSSFYAQSQTLNIQTYVTVTYVITSASILPSPVSVPVGKKQQLIYQYVPQQATIMNASWVTLNANIVTVTAAGIITGISKGTAQVKLILNGYIVAYVTVSVTDPNIDISCAGAENMTTPLNISGTSFDITVNDQLTQSNVSGGFAKLAFQYDPRFRVINCVNLSPLTTPTGVSETGFMELSGNYEYVYVGNVLLGKELTSEQVIALLENDERIKIVK
ncbi:MAG: hypothetical protein [Bacteriophage sp.]|nr:MAG: hypothetical protein [Bacteriophage sp.]